MPRLYSKNVFDPAMLEIILASLVVANGVFGVICLQWKFVTI